MKKELLALLCSSALLVGCGGSSSGDIDEGDKGGGGETGGDSIIPLNKVVTGNVKYKDNPNVGGTGVTYTIVKDEVIYLQFHADNRGYKYFGYVDVNEQENIELKGIRAHNIMNWDNGIVMDIGIYGHRDEPVFMGVKDVSVSVSSDAKFDKDYPNGVSDHATGEGVELPVGRYNHYNNKLNGEESASIYAGGNYITINANDTLSFFSGNCEYKADVIIRKAFDYHSFFELTNSSCDDLGDGSEKLLGILYLDPWGGVRLTTNTVDKQIHLI